jgi:hypothetical protein
MAAHRLPSGFAVLFLTIAGVSFFGCSTAQKENLETGMTQWVEGEEGEAQAAQPQPTGPTYIVEIRRPGYSTQHSRIQHQGATHLQDALTKSGAAGKLKRMELYVLRNPPGGGPRQRMTAEYDAAEKRVKWESDYAIYPGDHIVVIEDTSSEFDDMISRLMGPFGTKLK